MSQYNLIAATGESTVVAEYTPETRRSESYQSEAALEQEFIHMLTAQGYEYLTIHDEAALIANLRRQFTGRGKNERTYRTTPFGVRLASDQVLQQRQRKARCFAGAGLGASHQVAAFQHRRDRLLLNRGGFTVTLLGNGAQDIRA